jgi:ATP-dependent RNA helicase RhlE
LNDFKTGRSPLLIATDIASRGIDVDEITHVVNFDMPEVPETYIHRIGRTARAGASGVALSFCDREEINDLRSIERLIGIRLEVIEGEPDLVFEAPASKPEPRRQRAVVSPAADVSRHAQGRSRSGHARQSFASGRDGRRSSRGRNGGRPRRTRSTGR